MSRFRDEARANIALTIPIAGAQLAMVLQGVAVTSLLGELGEDALAGGGLATLIYGMLLVVASGILSAAAVVVAQRHARGDLAAATNVLIPTLWIAIGLCPVPMVLMMFAEPLLVAVGEPVTVAARASEYLRAAVWGFPAAVGFMALRHVLTGLGKVRIFLVTCGLAALATYGVGRLVMAGMFGPPGAGGIGAVVAAAHWATLVGIGAATYGLWRRPSRTDVPARTHAKTMREVIRIGLPIGAIFALEAGIFTAAGFLAGALGERELAAHQVVNQTTYVCFMIPSALGHATAVRVARAEVERGRDGVRFAALTGIGLAVPFMVVTSTVLLTLPDWIVAVFAQGASVPVVVAACRLLRIAAIFQVFDGVQGVAGGALRGLRDTKVPLWLAAVSYWVIGLGSGYVFAFGFYMGVEGLWIGLGAGLVAAAGLLVYRLHRRTLEPHAIPPVTASRNSQRAPLSIEEPGKPSET